MEEVDEMLTLIGLPVEIGSPVQSFPDSVVDELTTHLLYADPPAPDYFGAYS